MQWDDGGGGGDAPLGLSTPASGRKQVLVMNETADDGGWV